MKRTEEGRERETRARLLDEAAKLFSARGFARVTVRDICRAAGANVAAVNYHFHGKSGLYDAVVRMAIERMQQTTTAAIEAGRGKPPARQLAAYVEVFLERVVPQRDGWIHQLMVRELAEPTSAMRMVVRDVLEPRMRYLSGVVAPLLGRRASDAQVQRAVMSVHWHCLSAIDTRLPGSPLAPSASAGVDEIADHIATFALGGIRGLRSSRGRRGSPRGTGPARPARLPRRP